MIDQGLSQPHIRGMPHLDLTDDETAILTRELTDITGNDQCPPSPRIQTPKAVLAKLERPKARAAWRFPNNEQRKIGRDVLQQSCSCILDWFGPGWDLQAS